LCGEKAPGPPQPQQRVRKLQGCYIGQETLAKLANTNGVKQQLWGLQLSQRAAPGAAVAAAGSGGADRVGVVTSVVNLMESGHFGLGYIRCKSKGAQVDLAGGS
jgi:folate-binding Fe-S cluster repair protein YgfZ